MGMVFWWDRVPETKTIPESKIYEACKQHGGDESNEIEVVYSNENKTLVYDIVKDLRKENTGDGFLYWMRSKSINAVKEAV